MPLFFCCFSEKKKQAQVVNKHVVELKEIAKAEIVEPSDKIPSVKSEYVPKSPSARVVHINPRTDSESRKSVRFVQ
jgi:hypothetical protein